MAGVELQKVGIQGGRQFHLSTGERTGERVNGVRWPMTLCGKKAQINGYRLLDTGRLARGGICKKCERLAAKERG